MQTNSSKFARRYDREFKQNAVALIQSGRSITDVARHLAVDLWRIHTGRCRPEQLGLKI